MYLKPKKADYKNKEYCSDKEMFEYKVIKNMLCELSQISKIQEKTNKS